MTDARRQAQRKERAEREWFVPLLRKYAPNGLVADLMVRKLTQYTAAVRLTARLTERERQTKEER
jgi:hypothetical protein